MDFSTYHCAPIFDVLLYFIYIGLCRLGLDINIDIRLGIIYCIILSIIYLRINKSTSILSLMCGLMCLDLNIYIKYLLLPLLYGYIGFWQGRYNADLYYGSNLAVTLIFKVVMLSCIKDSINICYVLICCIFMLVCFYYNLRCERNDTYGIIESLFKFLSFDDIAISFLTWSLIDMVGTIIIIVVSLVIYMIQNNILKLF